VLGGYEDRPIGGQRDPANVSEWDIDGGKFDSAVDQAAYVRQQLDEELLRRRQQILEDLEIARRMERDQHLFPPGCESPYSFEFFRRSPFQRSSTPSQFSSRGTSSAGQSAPRSSPAPGETSELPNQPERSFSDTFSSFTRGLVGGGYSDPPVDANDRSPL